MALAAMFPVYRYKLPVFVLICLAFYILNPAIMEKRPCINCHKYTDQTPVQEIIPNPYHFVFPINRPEACVSREIDVIMPVSTALYNFGQRDILRKSTQYKYSMTPDSGLKILFFVGLPSDKLENGPKLQKKLLRESKTHRDIIQIKLEETYLNLVYKSMAVMYWIANYCSNSTFVLRTDDDVDINAPSAILALYRKFKWYPHFIMGDRRPTSEPVRDKKDKYYISLEEYSGDLFPAYIGGPAMGYPTATSLAIYKRAIQSKLIWVEDVMFAGIIREQLGIPAIGDNSFRTPDIHHQKKHKTFVYS